MANTPLSICWQAGFSFCPEGERDIVQLISEVLEVGPEDDMNAEIMAILDRLANFYDDLLASIHNQAVASRSEPTGSLSAFVDRLLPDETLGADAVGQLERLFATSPPQVQVVCLQRLASKFCKSGDEGLLQFFARIANTFRNEPTGIWAYVGLSMVDPDSDHSPTQIDDLARDLHSDPSSYDARYVGKWLQEDESSGN
jgi:hypothetical protein